MDGKRRAKEAKYALNQSCVLPAIKRVRLHIRDVRSLFLAPKTIKPHIRKAPKPCGNSSVVCEQSYAQASRSSYSSLPSPPQHSVPKHLPKKLSLPMLKPLPMGLEEVSPLLPWLVTGQASVFPLK